MKKQVELPLVEPIYSTYQNQGSGAAAIYENPSIRNWYLNEVMVLRCNTKFLQGFTTPDINIDLSSWNENPHLEKQRYGFQFTKGYINLIIKEMLDNGFYVYFFNVDDYYIEGKSMYHERHMEHDGLICGYDDEAKTYSIYSYDSRWIYRVFKTSQESFNAGRLAMLKKGVNGMVCGIKPHSEQIAFSPSKVCEKLGIYLDPSLKKYPPHNDKTAIGIVVHDYIAMYVDKLYDGSIPYERMDRRVFRLIWEHKKAMLERLKKAEEVLLLDPAISKSYEHLVADANAMRMLYASHHMKRRDSVLPIIHKKLISLKEEEEDILSQFVETVGDALK